MIAKPRMLLAAGLLALAAGNVLAADLAADIQIAIEDLWTQGNYAEASALGGPLLEAVASESGNDSPAYAEALLMLADIDMQGDEPFQAATRIQEAELLYQSLLDPDWERLIDAYIALGTRFSVRGDYDIAHIAYEDAQALSRRIKGLLNQDQIEILFMMSRNAWSAGDLEAANDIERERVVIEQRFHGDGSDQHFEAELRYAEWLEATGQYRDAELAYYELQRVVRRDFDNDPERRVEVLQAMARSKSKYVRPRSVVYASRSAFPSSVFPTMPMATTTGATKPVELERALRIIEGMDEPTPELQAAVLRDIGDWQILAGRYDDAQEAYLASWNMLGALEDGDVLQREWFYEPVVIRQGRLRSSFLSFAPGAPEGFVAVVFTVDPLGRSNDISVIDAEPAGLLDDAAISQIATSIYRPRIMDGQILPTSMQTIHRFQYNEQLAAQMGRVPGAAAPR